MNVCEGCCGRFVDDSKDIEPRDDTGVLGRLSLAVSEVCRHCDDRFSHGLFEVGLRGALDLLQDQCGELLGRVVATLDLDHSHVLVASGDRVVDETGLVTDVVELLSDEAL